MAGGAARPCRVLVVDDDPLVTESTSAMLEDLGHTVIEAMSGPRALDMLRLGVKVDVVVTDHAMPGMTGTELARQIRQIWPGLPRLSKPYVQEELAAQLAKVTSEAGANVISLDSARRA